MNLNQASSFCRKQCVKLYESNYFVLISRSKNRIILPYITFDRAVLQIGRPLARSQLVTLEFFIDINSFRTHCGPGVDSVSKRNEYQEDFLGVKAAGV